MTMILCIDTKDPKTVTVCLKRDDIIVQKLVEENEFGSQVLLPLITKVIEQEGITLSDLTAIEIDKGPGSYTGLRVGASVGQALGFTLNIPVNGKLNKPLELRYT